MSEYWPLVVAVLVAAGNALLYWVRAHAAAVVGFLDLYWSTLPNKELEDKAVRIFRETVSPIVPEHLIRRAIRWACRNRKRVRLRQPHRKGVR